MVSLGHSGLMDLGSSSRFCLSFLTCWQKCLMNRSASLSSIEAHTRLVECAAARAEGEDHGHPKFLGLFVGFLSSDKAADGDSVLGAQKLATHIVVPAALNERDVFGGVVYGATEVVLQVGFLS